MATLTNAKSRRLYSWWWDSHISPKNSRWLQENLADIDVKVKIMIKLIEHDAESFAQRAEMFYKNRPELMKLVEEFYRAYRALAERYDHATGALRQAHRKMAEVFPNEISLEFFDEPSPGSSTDAEAHRLGMPDEDYLQHEHLRASGHDVTEIHSKEADSSSGENMMKQLDHMSKGKCSSVKEEEDKCSEYKLLQKEIARLSKENEDLKNQISLELTRADKAEYEVNHLKEVSSRIKTEKVNALSQCEESKARVTSLENEISCMQADLKKLNDEMVRGAKFLNHAKVRSLSLEKANQALTSELDRLKQRIREQESELKIKEEELDQLSASLKVECQDRKKDELVCHSIEKRLAECQEEMRCLTMEIRSGGEKMKNVQMNKASLEEELVKIREKNDKLNEEKLLSVLKIINMQDEIISLRGLNEKLHDELNRRIEEKTALQQELHHLKEDRKNLEKRYHALKEEIHVVNLNIQFLQAMIKELRDENFELKETIKKHEDEKQAHLHTLKHMEMVSNKNAILEVSISDANNELERLRERIKTLEDSCYHLHGRISINQAEKALLVSHVEAFSKNMEKVSRENKFLENSLFDMNVELDGLRGRLKDMEESCQYLCDEKSSLLYEKASLTSQVESIRQSLKNLESRYAALEGKQACLEKEKGSTLQQVEELQELLRLEREEHSSLIKSSNSQLRTLVKQIRLLQIEGRQRQEELELEQLNIMNAQIEIFVLQRCLRDMREGNMNLSAETQKHQDSLRCTEKLISHLEQECHIQEEKIMSLTEHNEKLKEWIHLIIKLLKINLENVPLDHIKDEVLLQLILHEIRRLQRTTSEIQDEKQHLLLEKSVVLTLLEKFGAYVSDLRAEKAALERESKIKNDDYAVLKSENDKLLIMNAELRGEVQASNKREEALKAEVDSIFGELSDLRKKHCSLQIAVSNMSEENRSISEKLLQLTENKEKLEMENTDILADVVALDCLALVLKSCITEKGTELRFLSDGKNYLLEVQKKLDEEIKVINENIIMLHAKTTHSKESIPKLENHEGLIEFQNDISNANFLSTSAGVIFTENMNLSEANSTLQSVQGGDTDLCGNHCVNKLDRTAKMDKEQMEKNSYKETRTGYLDQENEMLKGELIGLQEEAEELKRRERYLTSALHNEKDKQKHSEVEISSALFDIQLVEIDAELFKLKVHELIKAFHAFETRSMIQMKILQGEITKRNFTIEELEEKLNALESENRGILAELKAFLLLVRSLCDDISHPEEYSMSQDVKFKSSNKSGPQTTAGHGGTRMLGLLKLKDLHSKIEVLEKVMMEAGYFLELERLESAASLNSTWKEIAGLTSSGISQSESSNMKCEQITRDVQLDIVVNSSRCSNTDLSDIWDTANANEIVDQVSESELRRTSEVSCSDQKLKATLVVPDDDETSEQMEMENGRYPLLELVAEKELGVDKLVLPRKLETQKQWNRRVIQRLSSDGHRLLVLHACVKELQKNIEASEKNNHSSKSELNPVKAQLKGAEGTISKLIESNSKLAKKVENLSASAAEDVIEKKGDRSKSQKQITDQARKDSEKIGRLELETQNIQYTLLKTEEECASNRAKVVDKSAGVVLKEYIYGRRDSRRQKKGSSCGCMRPKAESDD